MPQPRVACTAGPRQGAIVQLSRLLLDIQAAVRRATSQDQEWCERLRMASYFARSGGVGEALAEVERARDAYRDRVVPQVLALINLTEALLAFVSGNPRSALDKTKRCQVIAGAGGFAGIAGLAAAWQAHFHRNLGEWPSLCEAAVACLGWADSADAETLARLSLVLGDAWLEAGAISESDCWYRAARAHAVACGDDSLTAALLFNRAALHLFNLRLCEAAGADAPVEQCAVALEEASARNYSSYTGVNAMPALLEALRGQLLVVKEEFEAAVRVLQATGQVAHWPNVDALVRADLAYCFAKLGRNADAQALAGDLANDFAGLDDPSDVAQVSHRLELAYQALGRNADAAMFTERREESLAASEVARARASATLKEFQEASADAIVRLRLRLE